MASGFHAHRLQASCIGEVNSAYLFGESTAHIVFVDNEVAGPMAKVMSSSCWYDDDTISFASSPKLAGASTYNYGYTPQTGITDLPASMFFDKDELEAQLGKKKIVPYPAFPQYYREIQGWRWKYPGITLPLVKKKSHVAPHFQKFTNVNWTGVYPIDREQEDLGIDWLGNVYNDGGDASYPVMCSQGVQEPFLGETYYEDTLSAIDKSKQDYMMNFAPFCSPINVYDGKEKKIGLVDGLAFQMFVFNGALKNPLFPVLDPNRPIGTKLLLSTSVQYWSIEVWVYLSVVNTVAGSNQLRSPRIHTQRNWYYTQPYGNGMAPGTPYTFLQSGFSPDRSIRFSLLPTITNTLPSIVYETPWTKSRVYLTA